MCIYHSVKNSTGVDDCLIFSLNLVLLLLQLVQLQFLLLDQWKPACRHDRAPNRGKPVTNRMLGYIEKNNNIEKNKMGQMGF